MPILPEGPPPRAPTTAPKLELQPPLESLQMPGATSEGEQMTVYHIDPSSLSEKPWRRPGADLTDWFNYGFDEVSWREYGKKKRNVFEEREQLEQQEREKMRMGMADGGQFGQQQRDQVSVRFQPWTPCCVRLLMP